jgi:hypothetical protein
MQVELTVVTIVMTCDIATLIPHDKKATFTERRAGRGCRLPQAEGMKMNEFSFPHHLSER